MFTNNYSLAQDLFLASSMPEAALQVPDLLCVLLGCFVVIVLMCCYWYFNSCTVDVS